MAISVPEDILEHERDGFEIAFHTWSNTAYVAKGLQGFGSDKTQLYEIVYPVPDAIILSSQISPSGKYLAIGTNDGIVSIWDVATAKRLAYYNHGEEIKLTDFVSGDDLILSVGPTGIKTFRVSINEIVDARTVNGGLESADYYHKNAMSLVIAQRLAGSDYKYVASESEVNQAGRIRLSTEISGALPQ